MINLKKGLTILLIVVLFSFVSGHKGPFEVKGYVYDIVTGERIENPVVTIKHGGRIVSAYSSENPAPGNKNEDAYTNGKFDKVIFYGESGDSMVVSAFDSGMSNCMGSVSDVVPGAKLVVNIGVCCSPSSASGLKPSGEMHITESTDVEFSWIRGDRGNQKYPDFWETVISPKRIDEPENPFTLNLDEWGGWTIRTCNGNKDEGKQCCVDKGVGGEVTNNACPEPTNLEGSYEKGEGVVVTKWESSGVDSDGDVCHDIWEGKSFSQGDAFDVPSWIGLKDPANKEGETALGYLVTFWKVKSCDDYGGCSDWVEAIVPTCNEIKEECPNLYSVQQIVNNDCPGEEEKLLLKEFPWWLVVLVICVFVGLVLWLYERMKINHLREQLSKKSKKSKMKHKKKKSKH